MNYRHYYHAGNFADVFKHVLLLSLIQSLQKKDTAFCYLETHAGLGFYDLESELAQKNPEYLQGIVRLLGQSAVPEIIRTYLEIVQSIDPNTSNLTAETLRYYPGSPLIARYLLRSQDRIILSELHPDDSMALKNLFKHDRQVAVHHADGYQSLKAFLPPKEKRGLVFIDPPFEKKDDWQQIIAALTLSLRRWRNGMYAIWYPLKDEVLVERFYRLLQKNEMPKTLAIEFNVDAANEPETIIKLNKAEHSMAKRMRGCGFLVVNPPWQFDTFCHSLLPWLLRALSDEQQKGYYQISWLVPE